MKRGTLIAVGVFAGLLLLVLATRDRGNVNVGVPKLTLPAIDKDKVTSIEVRGATLSTLKKEGAGWVVIDPAKPGRPHPADPSLVTGLLDNLKDLKATDFITEKDEKLAEFEVDEKKGLAVTLSGETGPMLDVVFGKSARGGGGYLRLLKSRQVFVTPSTLSWMLRRDPNSWRKRAFFPAKAEELTRATATDAEGSKLPLELGADGKWALTAGTTTPPNFRFDAEAARQVATTLASLSASEFLDDVSDDVLGFAAPHLTWVAQLKDGKTVTVHQGRAPVLPEADGGTHTSNGIAVRVDGDPQVYLVPVYQAEILKKRLADLRDTTLLAFDPDKVKKVVIQGAGKKTVAVKEGEAWKVVEPKALPPGFEFDPAQVSRFVGSLKTFKAARMIEGVKDAEAGLAKPETTVELTVEGAALQRLEFGGDAPVADGPKQVYVRGSADALTYALVATQRDRMNGGLDLFKKPPPPPNFGQGGPGGQMRGLESLPPDVRRQLEAQLRQKHP